MRIMCVDNSKRDLHRIMKCCLKAPQVGFTTEKEALTWAARSSMRYSLYGDVEGGIRWVSTLAVNAKELCPEIAVIFVTDDEAIPLRHLNCTQRAIFKKRLR